MESNPRLRTAVAGARSSNMPNKNIENAIAKGAGQLDGVTYEEIVFEAYGPGGVAVVIETLTDNRNRTVSAVRHAVSKAGGNLGATNSVRWMFHSKGVITVPKDAVDEDGLMEAVLDAGAEDMDAQGEEYEITTSTDTFEQVRDAVEKLAVTPSAAELTKLPENTVKVEGGNVGKILRFMNALDDLEDTQNVYGNFDISDEDMAAFDA